MSDKTTNNVSSTSTSNISDVHSEVPNIRFSTPPPPPTKK